MWIELARKNYHDFYEFMNRDELDGVGFTMSAHQRLIGDLLTAAELKETLRFMLSLPPGHCKSTHSSHYFPAWWFGRNPTMKFLQAGHSQDFVANELGAKVKNIIDSDDFALVFPGIGLRSDMRAKDYWGLNNGKGKYVAKGVGQGISGFRGNFGMVDDPYKSRQDAESPTTRDKVFKWFTDDFSTRLLPMSPLGIIMTRWHSDDVAGRITDRQDKDERDDAEKRAEKLQEKLEQQVLDMVEEIEGKSARLKFEIINLPAIAEEDNDILGRQAGDPLWPEVYDLAALENLRVDMTSASWNSLYQGTPIDIEGGAVEAGWFQRYDAIPTRGNPETGTPNQIRRTVITIDAANTAKERSDYTVMQVWVEDLNRKHYLVDVVRGRFEFVKMSAEIDKLVARWTRINGRVDALLVEARGNGLAYCQLKEMGGAPAPLIPIEVGTQSKEFRFDEVTPMFEAGAIFLPNRAGWLADYEKELIAFPHGKNDDQVDATSQYLKWAQKRGRTGTKRLGGTTHASRSR